MYRRFFRPLVAGMALFVVGVVGVYAQGDNQLAIAGADADTTTVPF
jgi:hypothetical protein